MKIRRKKTKYVKTAEVGVDTVADVDLPVLRIVIIPVRLEGLTSLIGADQLNAAATGQDLSSYHASLVLTGPHTEDIETDDDVVTNDQETQKYADCSLPIDTTCVSTEIADAPAIDIDQLPQPVGTEQGLQVDNGDDISAESAPDRPIEATQDPTIVSEIDEVDNQDAPAVDTDQSSQAAVLENGNDFPAESAPDLPIEATQEPNVVSAIDEVDNQDQQLPLSLVEPLAQLSDANVTSSQSSLLTEEKTGKTNEETADRQRSDSLNGDQTVPQSAETDAMNAGIDDSVSAQATEDATIPEVQATDNQDDSPKEMNDKEEGGSVSERTIGVELISDENAVVPNAEAADENEQEVKTEKTEVEEAGAPTEDETIPFANLSASEVDAACSGDQQEVELEKTQAEEDVIALASDVTIENEQQKATSEKVEEEKLPDANEAISAQVRATNTDDQPEERSETETIMVNSDVHEPVAHQADVTQLSPAEALSAENQQSENLNTTSGDQLCDVQQGEVATEIEHRTDAVNPGDRDAIYRLLDIPIPIVSENNLPRTKRVFDDMDEQEMSETTEQAAIKDEESEDEQSDFIRVMTAAEKKSTEAEDCPSQRDDSEDMVTQANDANLEAGGELNAAEDSQETSIASEDACVSNFNLKVNLNTQFDVHTGRLSPDESTNLKAHSLDAADSAIFTLTNTATSNFIQQLSSTRVEQSAQEKRDAVDAQIQTSRRSSPRLLERVPSQEELSIASPTRTRFEMVVASTQTSSSRVHSAVAAASATDAKVVSSTTKKEHSAEGVTVTVHVQVNNPEPRPNVINVNPVGPPYYMPPDQYANAAYAPSARRAHKLTSESESDRLASDSDESRRHVRHRHHHHQRRRRHEHSRSSQSVYDSEPIAQSSKAERSLSVILVDNHTQTAELLDRATSTTGLSRSSRPSRTHSRRATPFTSYLDDSTSTAASFADAATIERFSSSRKRNSSQDSDADAPSHRDAAPTLSPPTLPETTLAEQCSCAISVPNVLDFSPRSENDQEPQPELQTHEPTLSEKTQNENADTATLLNSSVASTCANEPNYEKREAERSAKSQDEQRGSAKLLLATTSESNLKLPRLMRKTATAEVLDAAQPIKAEEQSAALAQDSNAGAICKAQDEPRVTVRKPSIKCPSAGSSKKERQSGMERKALSECSVRFSEAVIQQVIAPTPAECAPQVCQDAGPNENWLTLDNAFCHEASELRGTIAAETIEEEWEGPATEVALIAVAGKRDNHSEWLDKPSQSAQAAVSEQKLETLEQSDQIAEQRAVSTDKNDRLEEHGELETDTKQLALVTVENTANSSNHSVWTDKLQQLAEVAQTDNALNSNVTRTDGTTYVAVTLTEREADNNVNTWHAVAEHVAVVTEREPENDVSAWDAERKHVVLITEENQTAGTYSAWKGEARKVAERNEAADAQDGELVWNADPMQLAEKGTGESQDNIVQWRGDTMRLAEKAEMDSHGGLVSTASHLQVNFAVGAQRNESNLLATVNRCKLLTDDGTQTEFKLEHFSQQVEAKPEVVSVDTEAAVSLTDRSCSAVDFDCQRTASKMVQTNLASRRASPTLIEASAQGKAELGETRQSPVAATELERAASRPIALDSSTANATTRTSSVTLEELAQSIDDESLIEAELAQTSKSRISQATRKSSSATGDKQPKSPLRPVLEPAQLSAMSSRLSPRPPGSAPNSHRAAHPPDACRSQPSSKRSSPRECNAISHRRCSSGRSLHSIGVGSAVIDWNDQAYAAPDAADSMPDGDEAEVHIETCKPTIMKMDDQLKNVHDAQTKHAEHLKVLSTNMLMLTRSDQVKKERLSDLENRLRQVHDLYENLLNGSDGEYDPANFTTPKSNVSRQVSAVSRSQQPPDRFTYLPSLEPLFQRRQSKPISSTLQLPSTSGLPKFASSPSTSKLALPVIHSTPMPLRNARHLDESPMQSAQRPVEFPPIASRMTASSKRHYNASPRRTRAETSRKPEQTPSPLLLQTDRPHAVEIEYSRMCAIM